MDVAPSDMPPQQPRWKKLFRLAFTVAALAGLVYLLDRVGWQQIGEGLARMGWYGALLVLGLGLAECIPDAAAFKAAIPERIGLIPVLSYNQAGGLLNRFIPWEAGEVLKSALLRRRVSGVAAVTGTVLWNYVFKLSKPLVILSAALAGLLWGAPELRRVGGWMMLAISLTFLPYLGLYLLFRIGVAHRLSSLLARVRLLGRSPDAVVEKARSVDEALRGFYRDRPRDYWVTLLLQMVARLAGWAAFYAVLVLVGGPFSPATSGALWAALSMMSYLVGLLPTRLGTTEAGAFFVFKLVGLDPATGLMVQLISTVKVVVISGVLASLSLL